MEIKAEEEGTRIFNNPKRRKGRTLKKVIEDTMVGKVAEFFLVEFSGGFLRGCPKQYHDLQGGGKIVEVKAYSNASEQEENLVKKLGGRSKRWYHSDILYLFDYNRKTGEYKLYKNIDL